jgi:hypothetical protein
MPCKNCNSTRKQTFPCELTLAFPGKERLNLAPVYVFQKIFVCLDCGHAEVEIPASELEQLKKGIEVVPVSG